MTPLKHVFKLNSNSRLYTLPSSSNTGTTSNTALVMSNGSYAAGNTSSYGSYYHWRVANAKTTTVTVTGGDQAAVSICPKNWYLPTRTHFNKLISNVNATDFKITLAGLYQGSGLQLNGSYGLWHSRTAVNGTSCYVLRATSTTAFKDVYSHNFYGSDPVRCISS